MKKVLKTAVICVLLLGLCFGLSGCGAREPDYYTAGLEVTKLIGEMIHSRDYCSLFLYSMDQFDSIREAADTNDYDAPVAVYSLTMGSCDDLIRKLGGEEETAQVLRELISRGVPVCDFHRAPMNLEKVFMEVTGDA